MLVLTRKAGEVICIGGNIEVAVLEIRGERVRVGLTAPPDVRIRRHELPERVTPSASDFPSNHTVLRRHRDRETRSPVASR